MITLKMLGERLENTLNGSFDPEQKEYENIRNFGLDGIQPNVTYRFYVTEDEGTYKGAETDPSDPNKVVFYINVLLSSIGATGEGVGHEDYIGTMSTRAEFLIPHVDLFDDNKESVITGAVRALITRVLQFNQASLEEDPEAIEGEARSYLVGISYTMPVTGEKEIRAKVGASITLTVYIDYTFVAEGVASSDFEIYVVDGEGKENRIYPARMGLRRSSVTEGNVPSDSKNGASKNTVGATSLTINIDLAVRNSYIADKYVEYVIRGVIEPLDIVIKAPTRNGAISEPKKMVFMESAINTQVPLAASSSLILVEYLEEG